MKLLQSLTDHLLSNGIDSENLESWAEDGYLGFGCHVVEQGYEIKYVANFELSSVKYEPNMIFALIISWIQRATPERDTQGLPPPMFFSERLDGKRYDIGVRIEFIEQYRFVESENGNWQIGGKTMELVSDALQEAQDLSDLSIIQIVDNHTQDKALDTLE